MYTWISLYDVARLQPQELLTKGYISAEPDKKEFNTKLTFTIEDSHERILLTVPHYPEYSYGDYMLLSGDIEPPTSFETDTGRIFHYDTYLKKDKIYYVARHPNITLLSSGTHGSTLTKNLLLFKKALVRRIERYLPEPHASLLSGLLVGAKSSMGDELLNQFRITGVIHIVVLSGFNVTIIAEAIMRVLAFMGVAASAVFGSIAILFFTIMTGASATVVRASLMAFLVIIARVTGYQSEILRALWIAAFFMIMHNPMIVLYDPSFQLSFLATLGLVVLVPRVETYLSIIPRTKFDFRGLAAASLGTQIFVLPMLIWMTGEISLVSPAVNILVLWVVPVTMLLGFIMILVSFVSHSITLLVMTVTWLLLGYILTLVDWFAHVPFAIVTSPEIQVTGLVALYFSYICIYIFCTKKQAE